MPIFVSMLKGINVGPHHRIKMDDLRQVYASLQFKNPRTFIQSGNVIFQTREKNPIKLSKQIQDALEARFGFRPEVVNRTLEEMKTALAANPFAKRKDIEPDKLLITFLSSAPPPGARHTLDSLKHHPEEIHPIGRELYIYFPNGAGKTKLPWSQMERLLKVTGTARNLNSVEKMIALAQEIAEL